MERDERIDENFLQNYELEPQQISTLNLSVPTLNFQMCYHVPALLRV